MGQAFRRASGRIRAASQLDTSKPKTAFDRRPPPNVPSDKVEISKSGDQDAVDVDGRPRVNVDNILEERDPTYDAMLGRMVGRITSKPGGKPEMGESPLVQKSNRPMPKLRNTKPHSVRYEERPVPAGTLNVAQLRHVILLHQGKADNHDGPMDVHQIAEKLRIDVIHIQKVLHSLSLPAESCNEDKH